jgi:hypothetical protein
MEIATREKNGIACPQSRGLGIAAGLILPHRPHFKRARVLVHRYVVPALCVIALGLGGCSATATAPGGPDAPDAQYATATGSEAQYMCQGGSEHCKVEPAAQSGGSKARRCGEEGPPLGQPPCSCLTDYFFSTDRPFCTAVDWLVVMPVVVGVVLLVVGAEYGAGGGR